MDAFWTWRGGFAVESIAMQNAMMTVIDAVWEREGAFNHLAADIFDAALLRYGAGIRLCYQENTGRGG